MAAQWRLCGKTIRCDSPDVTSAEDVERYIQSTQPDAILHLAADSNTGFCEEHPEESYLVNVVSVENLAKAAQKHSIKMVWFSSDQIYNGNDELGLLKEDMDIAPENHLGRHQLLAEQKKHWQHVQAA